MAVKAQREGAAIAVPASTPFQTTLYQSLKKNDPSLPCSPQSVFESQLPAPAQTSQCPDPQTKTPSQSSHKSPNAKHEAAEAPNRSGFFETSTLIGHSSSIRNNPYCVFPSNRNPVPCLSFQNRHRVSRLDHELRRLYLAKQIN